MSETAPFHQSSHSLCFSNEICNEFLQPFRRRRRKKSEGRQRKARFEDDVCTKKKRRLISEERLFNYGGMVDERKLRYGKGG